MSSSSLLKIVISVLLTNIRYTTSESLSVLHKAHERKWKVIFGELLLTISNTNLGNLNSILLTYRPNWSSFALNEVHEILVSLGH